MGRAQHSAAHSEMRVSFAGVALLALAAMAAATVPCTKCDTILERMAYACETPVNGTFAERCLNKRVFAVDMRAQCFEIAEFVAMRSKELARNEDGCSIIDNFRLVGNQRFPHRLQMCTAFGCDAGGAGFFEHYATHQQELREEQR